MVTFILAEEVKTFKGFCDFAGEKLTKCGSVVKLYQLKEKKNKQIFSKSCHLSCFKVRPCPKKKKMILIQKMASLLELTGIVLVYCLSRISIERIVLSISLNILRSTKVCSQIFKFNMHR